MRTRTTGMVMAMGLLLGLSACTDPPASAPTDETGDTGETTDEPTTDADTTTGNPNVDGSTTDVVPEPVVTYHGHVRAILERHCVQCHQPGNIAPFPLTSYDEVVGLREAILLSIEDGIMPPWLAGPDCQDYLGDPTLREDDIQRVRDWVAEGGPEGNPADYVPPEIPPPPELSRIDATLQLPEPYTPVLQPDDYRCFLMDWPYDETVYVSGFAALPDQLETVHHMIAFAIEPEQVAEYEALDDAEPGPGYTCFGGPGGQINPTNPDSVGRWLGSWAPGSFAGDYAEGTGIRVDPGTKVAVQIHYNTAVDAIQPDQSSVVFKVDEQVDREAVMLLWANPDWIGGGMSIPAGESSVVHSFELDPTVFMSFITDAIPDFTPFEIYLASVHMHTLGTRAEEKIVRSDGSETCLLQVPRWDFNWQQGYRMAEPVTLNPGDRLRLACEWNNEAGEQTVNWGDGTGDEMCLGVFYAAAL